MHHWRLLSGYKQSYFRCLQKKKIVKKNLALMLRTNVHTDRWIKLSVKGRCAPKNYWPQNTNIPRMIEIKRLGQGLQVLQLSHNICCFA